MNRLTVTLGVGVGEGVGVGDGVGVGNGVGVGEAIGVGEGVGNFTAPVTTVVVPHPVRRPQRNVARSRLNSRTTHVRSIFSAPNRIKPQQWDAQACHQVCHQGRMPVRSLDEVEGFELHARKIILAFNRRLPRLAGWLLYLATYFRAAAERTQRTRVMVKPESAASSATGAATL